MSTPASPSREFRDSFWAGARGRLFLLVLIVVIPALVVQVIGAWADLQLEINRRKAEVTGEMAHARGDFETLLDEARLVFSDLARLNELRRLDNCIQVYGSLRLAYERLAPEAVNIGLADARGDVYCAIAPMLGAVNIAEEPYFQQALETIDLSVGAYSLNPLTGVPSMNLAYPVLSFDGQVQTVIFITYELGWLSNWQKEIALPPGATLTLVALDGSVLYRFQDGGPVGNLSDLNGSAWFEMLDGEEVVEESPDLDGTHRLNTLVRLGEDANLAAYLHLGYPIEELYTRINRSLQWRLASLGLTLLVALFFAYWGAEALFLSPLRHLMAVVGRVQAGDFQARAPAGYALRELNLLGQAVNRMADAVQQREAARQQAQGELEESEERFRAVFENAAVGVAVMSLDRRILQINQKAEKITGYSIEDMANLDPSLLAIPEDRSIDRHLFLELVEGRRDQYTVEKRYYRKNGEVFWGRVNFSAVRGPDGEPLYTIGMIEDISDEKLAAERLAAQEAESRRMLEQRIAERSEELKQANELLARKAAQDAVSAERTRLARELHDAVTQTLFSATLIADVLPDLWEQNLDEGRRRLAELHRLTRGALAEMRALLVELRPNALVEIPLPTLLRQLTEANTGRACIDIQLNVEGQRKLPPDVQIALYRITQEALNNIIKHSRASQAIVALRLGDAVRLSVADNGSGFDPSTVTADHLGLKIMRERAEAVGANFSLYSEPGEGAQISVVWQ